MEQPLDDSGVDKALVIKLAAAGAAVVVGLGALYVLTRPEKKDKKKKSKKSKKKKVIVNPNQVEEDEEEYYEKTASKSTPAPAAATSKFRPQQQQRVPSPGGSGEEVEDLEWQQQQPQRPARKAFDPDAAGIVQEPMDEQAARAWMDTFHESQAIKSAYAALIPILAALSEETRTIDETDKEGLMRTDFERWFITGFIAGIIHANPSLMIPQVLMLLRRLGQKQEDLSEAPMIAYAALLCSRTKEAMTTAFELWISSQPKSALEGMNSDKDVTAAFEKALNEFSDMTMSYMPLILMGNWYATRDATVLKQAVNTFEKFFEALRKSRVKEQMEGFYRGAVYALSRLQAMDPECHAWLEAYQTKDPTLKDAIKEALSAPAEDTA